MEVLKFINKNKKLRYEEIKTILENEYNLEIRLDKSDNYFMISCTNNSDFKNIFVRQCTGIIVEKETYRILHYFGEKAYNFVNNYNNNIISIESINTKNCLITPYMDGHIIKIFNYNNEWKFSTSKHTNIKTFKIKDKTLYEIFKNCILNSFDSLLDFFNTLDKKYCYSFMLINDKINMINKIFLNTFKEYHNLNNFKSLFNVKYNFGKYLIIEKDGKYNIKKIIAENDYIKNFIRNNICKFNNNCFNKSCNFIHLSNPDIEKNYKNYIITQKKINTLFKTRKCINENECKKHMQNKCIFIHDDDPINIIIY